MPESNEPKDTPDGKSVIVDPPADASSIPLSDADTGDLPRPTPGDPHPPVKPVPQPQAPPGSIDEGALNPE